MVNKIIHVLTISIVAAAPLLADDLPDSVRVTPLVKVIHNTEPAIASLFTFVENQMVSGSGAVIHQDGFVLTNNHVLPRDRGFALLGAALPEEQKRLEFVVVGRNPERDVAIVKLRGSGPFPTVPLGRSHDLLNGETVIVSGNPGGRGLVFTSGIISSRMVLSGTPNAFVMTHYENSRRPKFIQFDAASNGGNSGGPLINLEGRQIGIVSAKILQEQNVGFAIPVDDVYHLIEDICVPEFASKKDLGFDLKRGVVDVVIESVAEGSAAAEAGLKKGDHITSLQDTDIQHRIDWFLLLRPVLAKTDELALTVNRDGRSLKFTLKPTPLRPAPALEIDDSDLKPGLAYGVFEGAFSLVPDFSKHKAVSEGVVQAVNLAQVERTRKDGFAVQFQGYFKAPAEGLYRFVTNSDDGSNLFLDGELLVDNDGNHAPQAVGKLTYLAAGFHRLQVGYFQGNGGLGMEATVEHIGHGQKILGGDMIWHGPPAEK